MNSVMQVVPFQRARLRGSSRIPAEEEEVVVVVGGGRYRVWVGVRSVAVGKSRVGRLR